MEQLKPWFFKHTLPAFNELESVTALEGITMLHGAMNELINEYNTFTENVTKTINDFITSEHNDYELFKVSMMQHFQDFIDVIDLKIQTQDAKIQDAVDFMKTHLATNVEQLMEQLLNEGILHENLNVVYDEETQDLSIQLLVTGGE